jgi:hypothetical protein
MGSSLNSLEGAKRDAILSRSEVFEIDKDPIGIYQRSGCMNPCYLDVHGDLTDLIIHTENGRRGDQKLDAHNHAPQDPILAEIRVPLLNKLADG